MLIDRENEQQRLKQLVEAPGPRLGVLYGRRRVGKTFLLDNTRVNERKFYFLAGRTTPEQNRRELLQDLRDELDETITPEDYPNWRAVFRLLAKLSQAGPLVVILDEFQYLLGPGASGAEVTSSLVAVWDRLARDAGLTLLLCGSEISVMQQLNEADQPLYGRLDYFERLAPFDYFDATKMMGERSHREKVRIYGIYGGMPSYLAEIPRVGKLAEHVCENILTSAGPVYNYLDSLFKMEQGIREPGKYRAVLTAVASGETEVNDIAQMSGVTGKRNEPARRKLKELEDLYLVRRERNYQKEGGAYRFYVADPAVNFWYRFVHDNRKRLERGSAASIWENRIKPHLNTYIGHIFERLCFQAYTRFAEKWGLSFPLEWERWVGKDRQGEPVEIDIVGEQDNERLLVGEVKWSSTPVPSTLHENLLAKLRRLKEAGLPWAHQACAERLTDFIYFSAAGFTDQFKTQAGQENNLTLIDLADLFPGNT